MSKEKEETWECFSDSSYYDMWCVRKKTDRTFGQGFHLINESQARELCDFLNKVDSLSYRNYNLVAHIPYDQPDYLFSGSESDLKDFVNRHKGTSKRQSPGGKEYELKTVAGYLLPDLEVLIDGPEVESYLE